MRKATVDGDSGDGGQPIARGSTGVRILIVEDEPAMVAALRDNFEYEGFEVVSAANGEAGLAQLAAANPDLVLLDVMMPRMSGLDVCKAIRASRPLLPIIMLTARGQEIDKVVGLELGADDYVTKPFSIRELMARVRTVLRRAGRPSEPPSEYRFGDVTVDLRGTEVRRAGKRVELSSKEYALLAHLVTHAGETLSRDRLLETVWGYQRLPDDTHDRYPHRKPASEARRPSRGPAVHSDRSRHRLQVRGHAPRLAAPADPAARCRTMADSAALGSLQIPDMGSPRGDNTPGRQSIACQRPSRPRSIARDCASVGKINAGPRDAMHDHNHRPVVERVPSGAAPVPSVFGLAARLVEAGRRCAVATVVRTIGSTPQAVGRSCW